MFGCSGTWSSSLSLTFARLRLRTHGGNDAIRVARPRRDLFHRRHHGSAGRLSRDTALGEGPGVLVIHPWWGLNKTIKGMCDRLAKEGYVVFAPYLYHGKVATTIADAESLSGKLESAK